MNRFLVCMVLAVSALAITPAAGKAKKATETEEPRSEERSDRQKAIINEEAGKLTPLSMSLSEFSTFEIAPLTYSDAVAKEERKVKVAKGLEVQLRALLEKTFAEWATTSPPNGRRLLIKPYVLSLKVVGGGTRFFVGGLAGDSEITLELQLVDGDSGALIGSPTIAKSSSALAGAWSFGASDNNLDMYVAEIANKFLVNNYRPDAASATAPAKLLPLPEPDPATSADQGEAPAEASDGVPTEAPANDDALAQTAPAETAPPTAEQPGPAE